MPVVRAHAKINLTLDVLSRRADGYHEVETIMQSIALHDLLEFSPAPEEIIIMVEGEGVPPGEDNLVYRAAELLRRYTGTGKGALIRLVKAIPVAAGLGGGSSDAATALKVLNHLWDLKLGFTELSLLAQKLGADVPFFLAGGTALARGIGELIEPLPPAPVMGLVLVKPPFAVSTAAVYRNFCPGRVGRRPDNMAMTGAVKRKNIPGIAAHLANVLEPVTAAMHPEVVTIKEKLLAAGALGVLMSGSGPTVFGITGVDLESAGRVAGRFYRESEQLLVTTTFAG